MLWRFFVFISAECYPNPAKDYTSIVYNLPENSNVKITLTNIMGQVVKTIVNEYQYAGYNKVKVDANELKLLQGVYMYHIEVSSATASYNSIGKIIFER